MNNNLGRKNYTEWHQVQLPEDGILFVRNVDKKIMKKMPTKTETFVEQTVVKSIIDRMRNFILLGK